MSKNENVSQTFLPGLYFKIVALLEHKALDFKLASSPSLVASFSHLPKGKNSFCLHVKLSLSASLCHFLWLSTVVYFGLNLVTPIIICII